MDFNIDTDNVVTIRDLEKGQLFVRKGHLKKKGITDMGVRVRTDDPYVSVTLLGSRVKTFPSEKVYRVEAVE